MSTSSTLPTFEDVLADHSCQSDIRKLCDICYKKHPNENGCQLKIRSLKEFSSKIAIVALACSGNGQWKCLKCNSDNLCDLHQNMEMVPINKQEPFLIYTLR